VGNDARPAKLPIAELVSGIMLYAGILFVAVGAMSCVNAAFGLDLELFDTPLPDDWVAALFLLGLGVALTALGWAIGRWRSR